MAENCIMAEGHPLPERVGGCPVTRLSSKFGPGLALGTVTQHRECFKADRESYREILPHSYPSHCYQHGIFYISQLPASFNPCYLQCPTKY
jgi:hypothetical protein